MSSPATSNHTADSTPTPPAIQDDELDKNPVLAPSSPSAAANTAPGMPPGFAPMPMAMPAGVQIPPGFTPVAYMADPSDPNAPPHPVFLPGMQMGMQMAMPFGGAMFYGYGGMNMYPNKNKRKQVKNACTNCQKACKKCDEERPCPRCVKYGLQNECNDSVRKERRKGLKRGTYSKKKRTCLPVQTSHSLASPSAY